MSGAVNLLGRVADRLRARASAHANNPVKDLEKVLLAGMPEELARKLTEGAQARRREFLRDLAVRTTAAVAVGALATAIGIKATLPGADAVRDSLPDGMPRPVPVSKHICLPLGSTDYHEAGTEAVACEDLERAARPGPR
jgi:hypothetical protein